MSISFSIQSVIKFHYMIWKAANWPFVNTGIGILASALELVLALELASILHMYNKACKTDQGVM